MVIMATEHQTGREADLLRLHAHLIQHPTEAEADPLRQHGNLTGHQTGPETEPPHQTGNRHQHLPSHQPGNHQTILLSHPDQVQREEVDPWAEVVVPEEVAAAGEDVNYLLHFIKSIRNRLKIN